MSAGAFGFDAYRKAADRLEAFLRGVSCLPIFLEALVGLPAAQSSVPVDTSMYADDPYLRVP